MMLNPRYGFIGLVAFPYHVVVELLGAPVELLGWIAILTAALLGVLTWNTFIYFMILAYLVGTLISIGSVVMEEITYRRYQKLSDLARLLLLCTLEFFPYRQLLVFWRVVGMLELLAGKACLGPDAPARLCSSHFSVGSVDYHQSRLSNEPSERPPLVSAAL